MKGFFRGILWLIPCGIVLVMLVAGCRGITTGEIPNIDASPTVDRGGLSAEAYSTLASLEKLDDFPFYVMHYAGSYDYPQTGLIPTIRTDFGCSLFASLGSAGDMFFGRNFDWDFSPALLLFTDPPDGYASISMVDLTFLGITPSASRTLLDLPVARRTGLMAAPSLPFDGMNEYGLAVGMAAVPDEYADDASYDPSKPMIGSIGIIRQALDHARNVDEAVKIFGQYNIDFGGGPPIHYLLADPSGKAVLVEFYQREMKLLPNENTWHAATNHLRCIALGSGGCLRYHVLSERLSTLNGQLDAPTAMKLLAEVKQGITQWSALYDMTSGELQVVVGGDYQTSYTFHLDIQKP